MLKRIEAKMIAEEIVKLQQEQEPYMTIEDAAKFLSVTPKFLRNHPDIPHTRVYLRKSDGSPSERAVVSYQKSKIVEFMKKGYS